ncbi:MAG: hypothetical protein ACN0LA_00580, partial [Candidatus Longimicrobiales bacterium M2_2A_002]
MKIAASAVKQAEMKAKTPLLPLVPDTDIDALTKDNSATYELRSNPADNNSPKYKTTVRVLYGSESVRVIINWKRDVYRILEGLNVNGIANKVRIASTLMRGTPLTIFEASIQSQAQEAYDAAWDAAADDAARNVVLGHGVQHYRHNDHFEPALQAVVENLLPRKTLQQVKRYLRRECRKPASMKIRTFFQHFNRINIEELPELPPFNADQYIPNDEIIEILMYAVPKFWIKEMDRQGFDPLTHTVVELVSFLEQIETAEDFTPEKVVKFDKNNKDSKNGSSHKKNNKGEGSLYCSIHGKGNHKTDDCNTIKRLATRKNKESPNKSWNRKAEEAK